MRNVEIPVEGMTCGHCVSSIEKALAKVDGISEVDVSLEESLVTFQLDSSKNTVHGIKKVIDDLGYKTGCCGFHQ